jgi:hypothetical protein
VRSCVLAPWPVTLTNDQNPPQKHNRAPEQFGPRHLHTIKVDIWGFACTFLHMITGLPPWSGDGVLQICTTVGVGKQAPPLPADLPMELARLLSSCLEPDPSRRPAAAQLLKVLQLVGPRVEPVAAGLRHAAAQRTQLLKAARNVLAGLQDDVGQLVREMEVGVVDADEAVAVAAAVTAAEGGQEADGREESDSGAADLDRYLQQIGIPLLQEASAAPPAPSAPPLGCLKDAQQQQAALQHLQAPEPQRHGILAPWLGPCPRQLLPPGWETEEGQGGRHGGGNATADNRRNGTAAAAMHGDTDGSTANAANGYAGPLHHRSMSAQAPARGAEEAGCGGPASARANGAPAAAAAGRAAQQQQQQHHHHRRYSEAMCMRPPQQQYGGKQQQQQQQQQQEEEDDRRRPDACSPRREQQQEQGGGKGLVTKPTPWGEGKFPRHSKLAEDVCAAAGAGAGGAAAATTAAAAGGFAAAGNLERIREGMVLGAQHLEEAHSDSGDVAGGGDGALVDSCGFDAAATVAAEGSSSGLPSAPFAPEGVFAACGQAGAAAAAGAAGLTGAAAVAAAAAAARGVRQRATPNGATVLAMLAPKGVPRSVAAAAAAAQQQQQAAAAAAAASGSSRSPGFWGSAMRGLSPDRRQTLSGTISGALPAAAAAGASAAPGVGAAVVAAAAAAVKGKATGGKSWKRLFGAKSDDLQSVRSAPAAQLQHAVTAQSSAVYDEGAAAARAEGLGLALAKSAAEGAALSHSPLCHLVRAGGSPRTGLAPIRTTPTPCGRHGEEDGGAEPTEEESSSSPLRANARRLPVPTRPLPTPVAAAATDGDAALAAALACQQQQQQQQQASGVSPGASPERKGRSAGCNEPCTVAGPEAGDAACVVGTAATRATCKLPASPLAAALRARMGKAAAGACAAADCANEQASSGSDTASSQAAATAAASSAQQQRASSSGGGRTAAPARTNSQKVVEASRLEAESRGLSEAGQLEAAEAASRQALALLQGGAGAKHPNTIACMGRLAGVLSRQGKAAEAEGMFKQVLQHREALLGRAHPQVGFFPSSFATGGFRPCVGAV